MKIKLKFGGIYFFLIRSQALLISVLSRDIYTFLSRFLLVAGLFGYFVLPLLSTALLFFREKRIAFFFVCDYAKSQSHFEKNLMALCFKGLKILDFFFLIFCVFFVFMAIPVLFYGHAFWRELVAHYF